MSQRLEVLFTPADFNDLKSRDLSQTTCIVFDVLRATSSMITALANGASSIYPVSSISEAMALYGEHPQESLLAGERHGVLIKAEQTGSIDFHLGNSPREFVSEKVQGRRIIITTTNGTLALRACQDAQHIFIGGFLNMPALVHWLDTNRPSNLLLVCSGTYEQCAYEDVLAAGAICESVWSCFAESHVSDSAQIARLIYQMARNDLFQAIQHARNARRLLSMPELKADVEFCLQTGRFPLMARMDRKGSIYQIF